MQDASPWLSYLQREETEVLAGAAIEEGELGRQAHSREGENPVTIEQESHWIPAYAGMTESHKFPDHFKSKRSAFITLTQAETKSDTNFSCASLVA